MPKKFAVMTLLVSIVTTVLLLAICLHSLEEIHYLKSFFPNTFTVEQAYYASRIEVIKIGIIALPFVFACIVCFAWLWLITKQKNS